MDTAESQCVTVRGVAFHHEDIRRVVETFYRRVEHDPVLKVPFRSVHDWPEHIERLTHFWWIKFGGKPYMFGHYNPVLKHYHAGFNEAFLARWLGLFHEVLREHLNPEQCELWTLISTQMGRGLAVKNEWYRQMVESGKVSS